MFLVLSTFAILIPECKILFVLLHYYLSFPIGPCATNGKMPR